MTIKSVVINIILMDANRQAGSDHRLSPIPPSCLLHVVYKGILREITLCFLFGDLKGPRRTPAVPGSAWLHISKVCGTAESARRSAATRAPWKSSGYFRRLLEADIYFATAEHIQALRTQIKLRAGR